MPSPSEILTRKLKGHSALSPSDVAALRRLTCHFRELRAGEDFIRQGEKPDASAIVIEGMVGRYHTTSSGGRQYISFHIAGDWPDAQGLFLTRMDHSVCAMGEAHLCAIPHSRLINLFKERPAIGFAVWRETLIDAAIFREAVTNNSSRSGTARLAHFFCQLFVRADHAGLVREHACAVPLSQTQLGETIGMSIATVSRHLQSLRRSGAVEWKDGMLTVKNLAKLIAIGEFDDGYLHLDVQKK
jgi:CRP-like cAMP-binding protein